MHLLNLQGFEIAIVPTFISSEVEKRALVTTSQIPAHP